MRKEPLNSKRLRVINQQANELHDDVNSLHENMIDGDFESSMQKIQDVRAKLKLTEDMLKEGHILKSKR